MHTYPKYCCPMGNEARRADASDPRTPERAKFGEITPKSQLAASLLYGCGPCKYELSIIKYANGKPIREGGDTRRRATQL